MSANIQAVLLAAGKSSRFNTNRTKLLEPLCGQEMILYATTLLQRLNVPTTVVVGHQAEAIKKVIEKHHTNITFVEQKEQRGTGHAVLTARDALAHDHILIMNGDAPLLSSRIIHELIEKHTTAQASISLVVAHNSDPRASAGYGRLLVHNTSVQIVEARDYEGDTNEHCCVNAGVYIIEKKFLLEHLPLLQQSNGSQEYYLTDLVAIASQQKRRIELLQAPFDTIRGVNTLQELWAAEQIKRAELIQHWMTHGVRFLAPHNTIIDLDTTIGAGTIIGNGVHLLHGSTIGTDCTVESFSILRNAHIGTNVCVRSHSVIDNSTVAHRAEVGPFAHIRQHSTLGTETIIGNFVEVKQSNVGASTKAKHLSYLGDTTIGTQANIGAGTITCNHNGVQKHKTFIDSQAYIGSNATLIAPCKIGENAFVAAGCVVTEEVPAHALAIGRTRQANKAGYAKELRARMAQKSTPPKQHEIG